jgi:hypothetical protein
VRAIAGDRGAVTVEAALALCSLVTVMALAVAAIGAATAHLRCLDAAREAARLVARGEPDRARDAVARIAPGGAMLEVRVVGDEADVRVAAAAVAGLPGLRMEAAAHAVLEPGAVLAAEIGEGGSGDPALSASVVAGAAPAGDGPGDGGPAGAAADDRAAGAAPAVPTAAPP